MTSGRVVVAGIFQVEDAPRIEVIPGSYRARIYYGNLGSPANDGLASREYYKIFLWSAAPCRPRVLKQRKAAGNMLA